jgi:hypothetical protein
VSITINGVSCEEVVDGFEEGVHSEGPVAQKKFLCAWSSRYALANGLLGFVTRQPGQTASVQITGPMAWPESPNMLAREISIEGVGQPTQGASQIQFPQAIVTANYGVPTWQALPYPDMAIDPTTPFVYATQDIDFGSEMVQIEKSSVALANGHKLADTPYAFPLPHAILSITLQRVPFLPAQAIITGMQRPLNNATFLGVSAGYLMLKGVKNHGEASTDGTFTQSLSYVFAYRPILRWDEVLDPDGTSGPQQVRYNGAAILLRSDFRALIPSNYYG